jgi:Leucine Rich repeat
MVRLLDSLEIHDPPNTASRRGLKAFLQSLNRLPFRSLRLHNLGLQNDSPVPLGFGEDMLLEQLLKTEFFSRLRSLALIHCGITDDGATTLARSLAKHKLTKLDLTDNFITAIGLDALKQVGHSNVGHQFLGLAGVDEDYV